MSGQCCEVKQRRARSVAGRVTQALEQGRLGSCAHAGYHQYYNGEISSRLFQVLCSLEQVSLSTPGLGQPGVERSSRTSRVPSLSTSGLGQPEVGQKIYMRKQILIS